MLSIRIWICIAVMLLAAGAAAALSDKEQLGKDIFFDNNLSEPTGQACAVCHTDEVGFTGPNSSINAHGAVYEGAVQGRFGNRKPPSSAYATFSPVFFLEKKVGGHFVGGNFWDGRATGEKLGNPAADQAQDPFLNPLEQNNPDPAAVVFKVCGSSYVDLFKDVWGADACDNVSKAYDYIALSIAAFEASNETNQFSSKFDAYLEGKAELTDQEKRGLNLFKGSAKCWKCHPNRPESYSDKPLFTDFTYHNIGTPRNPENPFYNMIEFNPFGVLWIDPGLGGFLEKRMDYSQYAQQNYGKHKVPTLRNVDKRPSEGFVKAYSHNGFFKSLKEIVHFYNTRDVLPVCPPNFVGEPGVSCWPEPEIPRNLNTKEVGDLGLTDEEEDAIVAFLKTLSDGFTK